MDVLLNFISPTLTGKVSEGTAHFFNDCVHVWGNLNNIGVTLNFVCPTLTESVYGGIILNLPLQ